MAKRKPTKKPPKLQGGQRSVEIDADKLDKARKYLNAPSDAEVVRLALEHLLSHFEPVDTEEE